MDHTLSVVNQTNEPIDHIGLTIGKATYHFGAVSAGAMVTMPFIVIVESGIGGQAR